MVKIILIVFLSFLFVLQKSEKDKPAVIPAHSHNDYEQEYPLKEALGFHFKSVEADIFTVGDSLFVAHSANEIKSGRTLISLYLEPLRKRIEQNRGSVYKSDDEIFLLIDIKDNAEHTYILLHQTLEKYKEVLTVFENGKKKTGAVTVVVSGNRPIEMMRSQKVRFAGFDGRIENLETGESPVLMPMVSDNWKKCFSWDGSGNMPDMEKQKLVLYAEKARSKGYILRFWGTPDRTPEQRKEVWKVLTESKTGLIGTDHLGELQEFFMKESGIN